MALSKKNVKKIARYLDELSKSYYDEQYSHKFMLELELILAELTYELADFSVYCRNLKV